MSLPELSPVCSPSLDEASSRFHRDPLNHSINRSNSNRRLRVSRGSWESDRSFFLSCIVAQLGIFVMALKRFLGEGEEGCDGFSAPEAKRPSLVFAGMREVIGAQCMQRHLSKLEPFLRRVVQEEVQNALNHHAHSAPSRLPATLSQPAVRKQYQLIFHNTLPHTIYTGSRIEAEGGVPVQVWIVDSCSKKIISSGPLASAKIEILALDGDFGNEDEWSEKYFVNNIVRERDGKRPLLTGDLTVTMIKGVGYVNDATFTDNSSWIRSRKFRLGARVCTSRLMEGRIREAVTDAFLVKDHRGESYRKHHPPSLKDEVWRLEKIGKDGAFHRRLAENEICTVQDFLRNLVMDSSKLRCLLGNGMSNKIWEATIEHARECTIDDKLYSYCRGQGILLIFNSIFQLIGAIIDQIYHPVDEMTGIDASISLPVTIWPEPEIPDLPGTLQGTVRINRIGNQTTYPMATDVNFVSTEPDAQQLSLLQQCQTHETCHEILEDVNQLKDIFDIQSHPVQRFNSFNNYNFNGREFFEQQYVGYNSDFELLTSPPMPLLCDHGKALCQTLEDDALSVNHASQVPNVDSSSRIRSSRWVKLIAALKWMSVLRQLAARRAAVAANMSRIAENGYPALTTAMYADATTKW